MRRDRRDRRALLRRQQSHEAKSETQQHNHAERGNRQRRYAAKPLHGELHVDQSGTLLVILLAGQITVRLRPQSGFGQLRLELLHTLRELLLLGGNQRDRVGVAGASQSGARA